jgi:membrane protein DedA with SNARE-associated domain
MSILTTVLGAIGGYAVDTINALGYVGVFVLMAFESMIIPLPSELVMPFAGFLVAQGRFSMMWVILFATIGSLTGSLISYFIGKFGGNRLVLKYGKYVLLSEHDLKKTEQWFTKRGELTIFIGRFIPVVRHVISIPAGMAKMDLKKFCLYTVIGAGIWNAILAYAGYFLGQNWNKIRQYTEPISILVACIIVIGIVYFIYNHVFHAVKYKKK